MRCADFQKRLDDLLDRRLTPESDATLQAHLAGCLPCRQRQAALAVLLDTIATASAGSLPALAEEPHSYVVEFPVAPAPQRAAKSAPWVTPGDRQQWPAWSKTSFAAAALAATVLLAFAVPGLRHSRMFFPGHAVAPTSTAAAPVPATGNTATTDLPKGELAVAGSDRPAPPQPNEAAAVNPEVANPLAAEPLATISALPSPIANRARGLAPLPVSGLASIGPAAAGRPADSSFASQPLADSVAFASAVLRLPDVGSGITGDANARGAAAVESLSDASHSLMPVAVSMTETWQILKQALPATEPPRG